MASIEKAKEILAEHLAGTAADEELVVNDSKTLRRPYGWVFFYNTRRFLETGDIVHALGGNGPLVVLEADGSLHALGTARGFEEELRSFEVEQGL